MKTTWRGNYFGNSIEVQNTWFKGESLFINNSLQDFDKNGFGKSSLFGIIKTKEDKVFVRVKLIAGFFKIKCYVFIDGKEIKMEEVK